MFCNDDETQSTKNYYIEKKKRELSIETDIGFHLKITNYVIH